MTITKQEDHKPCHCSICIADRYWSKCGVCKDGHPSFWKTVTESPQWIKWYDEQMNRQHKLVETLDHSIEVFDIDESVECGGLGKEHFQAFLKFIKTL